MAGNNAKAWSPIATRHLARTDTGAAVIVQLGRPRRRRTGEFECRYRVRGVGRTKSRPSVGRRQCTGSPTCVRGSAGRTRTSFANLGMVRRTLVRPGFLTTCRTRWAVGSGSGSRPWSVAKSSEKDDGWNSGRKPGGDGTRSRQSSVVSRQPVPPSLRSGSPSRAWALPAVAASKSSREPRKSCGGRGSRRRLRLTGTASRSPLRRAALHLRARPMRRAAPAFRRRRRV